MGGLFMKSLTTVGIVVAGLVALKLVLGLFGAVFGIASFLLFTVLPLAFIGWLVVSVIRHWRRRPVD